MSDFATEAFTLLGVAIVIIGLRTTARWLMVGPENFQADDYLMLVACVSIHGSPYKPSSFLLKLHLSRWCTAWKLLQHISSVRGSKDSQTIP